MLRTGLFKDALNGNEAVYSEEKYSDMHIISVKMNTFSIHHKFLKDCLSDVYCEYLEESYKSIPLFIMVHCQSLSKDNIKVIDNDLVLYANLESITFISSIKIITENIISLNLFFTQFKDTVVNEYKNYLENTKAWLESNCPEKSESLYAILNLPEDDYILDIEEREYIEWNLSKPSNGFQPFKVMVNRINAHASQVRLMVKDENGFRYFLYWARNDIDFGSMLETFAEWVSKGGTYGNQNTFYEIDDKKRILEYIKKHKSS